MYLLHTLKYAIIYFVIISSTTSKILMFISISERTPFSTCYSLYLVYKTIIIAEQC